MNSFLIDECLTPDIVAWAHSRGFSATHVVYLQREGASDRSVAQLVLRRDDILVTNNARDFLSIYAKFDVHPGLVIILPSVSREAQIALFEAALRVIETRDDLVNHLLEVSRDGSTRVVPWSAFDSERKG